MSSAMPFCGVYGHERQINSLKNALLRNRVAQAYIFDGIAGVGKKTTALAFARALNCLGTEEETGELCASCRKIETGNHPDILFVAPEGKVIKIDQIRELGRRMCFRPLEGRRRVVIIEKVHAMNDEAANALLKTLEEPAPGNVLILLTSRSEALPRTIVSRCQRLRFAPLPASAVEAFLKERRGMGEEESSVLAAASAGCIGRVLDCDHEALRRFEEDIIGVLEISGDAGDENPLAPFLVVERFGNDRAAIIEKLELVKEWFRDVLVLHETGREELVIHRDLLNFTRRAADRSTSGCLTRYIECVEAARRAVDRNANSRLVLESMMFKLRQPLTDRCQPAAR